MDKIPFEISAYIKDHFREGCLSDIKTERTESGHFQYKVKVYEDQLIHLLEFNEKGHLIKSDERPVYNEDYFEGMFYGNKDE